MLNLTPQMRFSSHSLRSTTPTGRITPWAVHPEQNDLSALPLATNVFHIDLTITHRLLTHDMWKVFRPERGRFLVAIITRIVLMKFFPAQRYKCTSVTLPCWISSYYRAVDLHWKIFLESLLHVTCFSLEGDISNIKCSVFLYPADKICMLIVSFRETQTILPNLSWALTFSFQEFSWGTLTIWDVAFHCNGSNPTPSGYWCNPLCYVVMSCCPICGCVEEIISPDIYCFISLHLIFQNSCMRYWVSQEECCGC